MSVYTQRLSVLVVSKHYTDSGVGGYILAFFGHIVLSHHIVHIIFPYPWRGLGFNVLGSKLCVISFCGYYR